MSLSSPDLVVFAWTAVSSHRLRSILSMAGIAIGVAAIVVLTSLGIGVRAFVVASFAEFGTNIIQIRPGKQPVGQVIPTQTAPTTNPLTLGDAQALQHLPGIEHVTPCVVGAATVTHDSRSRAVFLHGCGSELMQVWRFPVGQGRFFPPGDDTSGAPVIVLGATLKRELFGELNPLGEYVYISGQRFMVIGVMVPKGRFLALDLDDAGYMPIVTAQRLFNRNEVARIDVSFANGVRPDQLKDRIRETLAGRRNNDGTELTIATQGEMLGSLDRIVSVLTTVLAAIAAISLLVGATGITTVMWISVNERRSEIGLAKALGAGHAQILTVFLTESVLLAVGGGAAGLLLAMGSTFLVNLVSPNLPLDSPPYLAPLTVAVSALIGVASGLAPAHRAARLDPIEALRTQ